jgi:DNA-binding transcriptional LysR family regulator
MVVVQSLVAAGMGVATLPGLALQPAFRSYLDRLVGVQLG